MKTRAISTIAQDILDNWNAEAVKTGKPWRVRYYGAVPYLQAMFSLNSISQNYGMDSGRSVIAYFLGNVTTWRGEKAKAIKKELNELLKG